jgi:hypothetical protein
MPRRRRENIIKKIKRLWNDPKFAGAFQGANSFRDHLFFEKDVDAKLSTIYKALSGDDIFFESAKYQTLQGWCFSRTYGNGFR